MNLKVLLPFQVFLDKTGVKRIVADSNQGSFGILPRRLDCVLVIEPGILCYETDKEGEVYIALDEGILVKTGEDVVVSARNAIGGADLGRLREKVESEIMQLSSQEKKVRSVLAKLESEFIRRFREFHFK